MLIHKVFDMKCPHCGQEHPDNFQFCPVTGKNIEVIKESTSELIACTNPSCDDYGKKILPADSRFCPTCGKKIKDNEEYINLEVNGIKFRMIKVKHGSFEMGSNFSDKKTRPSERPCHKVIITKDYYIGETTVTNKLWNAVMGGIPSSEWKYVPVKELQCEFQGEWENEPVTDISYDDCIDFIKRLNVLTNMEFRLPTEAEWEFAAKGGIKSKFFLYCGSNNPDEVAWHKGNYDGCFANDVARLKPNELGIYDMSGNVGEWCSDSYTEYSEDDQVDPIIIKNLDKKVVRGGAYDDDEDELRSVRRSGMNYWTRVDFIGLRLVMN